MTDDTRSGSPDADPEMTTPIVTEQPQRLTPVDRDTFCDQQNVAAADWTPPRRRPQDA